jgi:hypothetical protein
LTQERHPLCESERDETAGEMSQEKIEIVQRFFEANERAMKAYWRNLRSIADAVRDDDLEPEAREVWSLVHPDAVWKTVRRRGS